MTHSGKYLYFNIGSGDGASVDFGIWPLERFQGIDVASGDLIMYFKARTGKDANDSVTLDVADTNQDVVIKAIMKAIATMNAGVLKICDKDNNSFLHEKITDCTINAVS
jgi:hypothetical protein